MVCRVSMGEMVGEGWELSYDAERGMELMGCRLGGNETNRIRIDCNLFYCSEHRRNQPLNKYLTSLLLFDNLSINSKAQSRANKNKGVYKMVRLINKTFSELSKRNTVKEYAVKCDTAKYADVQCSDGVFACIYCTDLQAFSSFIR